MRWNLFCCILLASAHDIISTARPKRDLWSFKNLVSSKLFGTDTVVIQLPNIPKNETYQLFGIKGYDHIFLKVTQKPKEIERPAKAQDKDPVMLRPEIAIIGNYLGTTTQRETLLALEIAKNLLDSGLLESNSEKTEQDVAVIPLSSQDTLKGYVVSEPEKTMNVITEEREPIYVDPPVIEAERINIVNHQPIIGYPERYPPVVIGSELKNKPLRKNYIYKQKAEDADITYESDNNHKVIVTRINKVPIKPHYIGLRLADVVSIAANPYLFRFQQQDTDTVMNEEQFKEPLKVVPVHSYVMENIPHTTTSHKTANHTSPDHTTSNLTGYVDSSVFYTRHPSALDINHTEVLDLPKFIKKSKLPFDIRNHLNNGLIDNLNKYINAKLDSSKKYDNIFTSKPMTMKDENYSDENNNKDPKVNIGNSLINPGKNVNRYNYDQMGDEGTNYTVVKIEDPKLNQSEINLIASDDDIPQNFVYVPPGNVPIPRPMPNAHIISSPNPIVNTNNVNDQNSYNRYDEYEVINSDTDLYSKTSIPLPLKGDLNRSEIPAEEAENVKTNNPHSLTKKPIIVVPETNHKENNLRTSKGVNISSQRPPEDSKIRLNVTL